MSVALAIFLKFCLMAFAQGDNKSLAGAVIGLAAAVGFTFLALTIGLGSAAAVVFAIAFAGLMLAGMLSVAWEAYDKARRWLSSKAAPDLAPPPVPRGAPTHAPKPPRRASRPFQPAPHTVATGRYDGRAYRLLSDGGVIAETDVGRRFFESAGEWRRFLNSYDAFAVGDRVFHPELGAGTVAWAEGDLLKVRFDGAGDRVVLARTVLPG